MRRKLLLLAIMFLAVRLAAADAGKPARPAAADRKAAKQAVPRAAAGIGGFEQVLTDEQRQTLREFARAGGEKLRASQQEAIKLRRELQEAALSGKADESVIKQKSEAIAKLEAEVLAARMNSLANVAATLTPEQKEKIKEMSGPLRAARPGLGAGPRKGGALRTPSEPAAPPPPEK